MSLFDDLVLRNNGEEVDASWWNTIIVALRQTFPGAGGLAGEVVGTTDEQDLSNKTFTDPITLDELASTPANPVSGKKKIYAKDDGKVYTLDSGGNEVEVGSGAGGSGSKNYISIESAELEDDIGNWLSDDGLGGVDANLFPQLVDFNELAGTQSILFNKTGTVDTSGSFIKCLSETIDPADRGKILFGSFSYDATNGNYNSGDVVLEVYDVTNSEVLYSGSTEAVELPSGKGSFSFTASTEETTEQVELRLKCVTTGTAPFGIYLDEFKFGPAAKIATVLRKSLNISLAGSGNFTGGSIQVERVGNIVTTHLVTDAIHASLSTPTSAVGLIPSWARPSDEAVNGHTSTDLQRLDVLADGSFRLVSRDTDGVLLNRTSFGAGLNVTYTVPADLSPTITSNELSLQTIRVRAKGNSGGTVSTSVPFEFDDVVEDSSNSWNGTQLTAPKSGRFKMTGFVRLNTSVAATIRVFIDGAANDYAGSTGASSIIHKFHWEGYLEKGQTWELRTTSTYTQANLSDSTHYIEISNLPDYSLMGVMTQGITRDDTATDSVLKLPDGTMIAHLDISVTDQALNTAYGSFFQGTRTWTFPEAFIEPPTVTCSLFRWGTGASWGSVASRPSASSALLRGYDISSRATGTNVDIQAIAIGRWR